VNGIIEEGTTSAGNWLSMQMDGEILINLKTSEEKSLQKFNGSKVHAVTGIGNPQRFYTTLTNSGLKLTRHDYPDHYSFKQNDLDFADDLPIIMTEKDAVKCKSFATDNVWFFPISAVMEADFDNAFLAKIIPLLDKDTSIN
jgi:tetraacyldisaccharide 4'-kinase